MPALTRARALWADLEPAERRDTLHALWALPLAARALSLAWIVTP